MMFGVPKFIWKRGQFRNLPKLDEAEPAFTTDTKQAFIGSKDGNVELAKKEVVDSVQAELQGNINSVQGKTDDIQNQVYQLMDGNIETGVLQTKIAEKLTGLETQYAPDLNQVKTSLADRATKETTTDLQTQVNNLVIGVGSETESYAEIKQTRSAYPVLNDRFSVNESNLINLQQKIFGDLKGKLRRGYYNTNGDYLDNGMKNQNGTDTANWFHYYVFTGGLKTFTFEYPLNITLRINYFRDGVLLSRPIISNGSFTVPDGCTGFAINIPLPNASPAATSTVFNNFYDAENIIIKSFKGMSEKITDVESIVKNNITETKIVEGYSPTVNSTVPLIGYYGSTTGVFNTGTNWYHFYVIIGSIRKFKLSHPTTKNVRIVYFKNGSFAISDTINTNEDFTVNDEYTSFAINIPLKNQVPSTTFPAFDDTSGFSLIEYASIYKTTTLENRLKTIEANVNNQPNHASRWLGKNWVVFGDSNSKEGDAMPKYHHIISKRESITLYNYAVSGGKWGQDATLSIDSKIDGAIANADLITFMCGGNDVASVFNGTLPLGSFGDTTMTTFYGCLDYTIGRIVSKYSTKIIGAMAQMKRGEGKETTIQGMVKALKDVCGKYGIPVLDLYNGGNIHAYNSTFISTYMTDGIHLNALAHEKILAPKVFSWIESL